MTVTVDLDFNDFKPNYKNLLIVGANFKGCLKNGFPKEKGLKKLYTFSDSVALVLDRLTKNKLVGIITYQCVGLDVYYVKDTLNIRNAFNKLVEKHFNKSQNYLIITRDKNWDYYYKNLYPINVSNDYFLNQEYLIELANKGDALTGLRRVEHWMSFNSVKNRTKFIENVKSLNFSIDSVQTKKNNKYLYKLMISRKDSVYPEYINNLTSLLKTLTHTSKGVYGGWGIELKTED